VAAQWCSAVLSASANFSGYESKNVLGAPDRYPFYGVNQQSVWTPNPVRSPVLVASPSHWIELHFLEAAFVSKVEIYEISAPGACTRVQLLLEDQSSGTWVTVWERTSYAYPVGGYALFDHHHGMMGESDSLERSNNVTGARIFAPTLQYLLRNKTQGVRLEFNTSGWTESYGIDAVRIISTEETYVSDVDAFSSQYTSDVFAAKQLLGPPDAYPAYGILPEAWAPSTISSGNEWLVLAVGSARVVASVEIFETNAPGHCVEISLEKPDGSWDVVWKGVHQEGLAEVSRIFTPTLSPTTYATSRIKISADTTGMSTFYQIDAVRVTPRTSHWSLNVTDSSCTATKVARCRSAHHKLFGAPNQWPVPGVAQSWTPTTMNAGHEFLEVSIGAKVIIASVTLFETHAPGALKSIRFLDPGGSWDTVWEDSTAQQPDGMRTFAPPLLARRYTTQHVRLEFDTTGFTAFYALDAVEVREGILPEEVVFWCAPCLAGFYKATNGSAQCVVCPLNSHAPAASTERTHCTCNAGSTGADGLACAECLAGTYKNAQGDVACGNCAAGKYSTTLGASSSDTCGNCAAGKYSTTLGASSSDTCLDCIEGKYLESTGNDADNCIECADGKYSAVVGSDNEATCVYPSLYNYSSY